MTKLECENDLKEPIVPSKGEKINLVGILLSKNVGDQGESL